MRNWIGRLVPLVALLLAGWLTAGGAHAHGAAPGASCSTAAISPGGSSHALVVAQNDFGFRLLRTLLARDPSGDTFLSPTSIALALAMAYDGARGTTAAAMARALGISRLSRAQVRFRAAGLLAALHPGQGNGLVIANSLWAQQGTAFRPAFLQHAQSSYGATVRRIDLHSAAAPGTINSWVNCATDGKIPSIVGPIPPQTILYLINAVYFKGNWAQPFNKAFTVKDAFTTPGGDVKVPMMVETAPFGYYKAPTFQMVSLPYRNPRFSMLVLLPNAGTSLRSFVGGITAADWSRWMTRVKGAMGTLSLPHISLRTDYNLIPSLTALGMGIAFTDSANLSGMCVQPCAISEVRHRALLTVNEQGTVAAGVTSVGVVPTSIQVPQFTMSVDRPFVVAIADRSTGAVLFAGAVNNPKG